MADKRALHWQLKSLGEAREAVLHLQSQHNAGQVTALRNILTALETRIRNKLPAATAAPVKPRPSYKKGVR